MALPSLHIKFETRPDKPQSESTITFWNPVPGAKSHGKLAMQIKSRSGILRDHLTIDQVMEAIPFFQKFVAKHQKDKKKQMINKILECLKTNGPQRLETIIPFIVPDYEVSTFEDLFTDPTMIDIQHSLANLIREEKVGSVYQVKDRHYDSINAIPENYENGEPIGLNDIQVIFSISGVDIPIMSFS